MSLIDEYEPDFILLVEVNARWINELRPLDLKYKYSLKQAQENEYGIALYSRLPLENAEIKFLTDPHIPSVRADIILPSKDRVEIYGLHPEPPRLKEGSSTQRDAELVKVAKAVRNTKTPVIVTGDLNDVAWSHTTRLFRRISGLLDPRVGRGAFPTFPVHLSFLRFPLDYVFHSNDFRLNTVERLDEVGSDHFAMYVELTLQAAIADGQAGPELEDGDLKEADETIDRARN